MSVDGLTSLAGFGRLGPARRVTDTVTFFRWTSIYGNGQAEAESTEGSEMLSAQCNTATGQKDNGVNGHGFIWEKYEGTPGCERSSVYNDLREGNYGEDCLMFLHTVDLATMGR